jgi:hypothetical protein
LIASFTSSVAAQLLGDWLYDRLKSKSSKVVIGGEEIKVEKAALVTAIKKAAKKAHHAPSRSSKRMGSQKR